MYSCLGKNTKNYQFGLDFGDTELVNDTGIVLDFGNRDLTEIYTGISDQISEIMYKRRLSCVQLLRQVIYYVSGQFRDLVTLGILEAVEVLHFPTIPNFSGNSLCPIDTSTYRVLKVAIEPSAAPPAPTFACALLDNGGIKCWYLPVTQPMGADLATYFITGESITSVCIQSDLTISPTRTIYVVTNSSNLYSMGIPTFPNRSYI